MILSQLNFTKAPLCTGLQWAKLGSWRSSRGLSRFFLQRASFKYVHLPIGENTYNSTSILVACFKDDRLLKRDKYQNLIVNELTKMRITKIFLGMTWLA